MRILLGARRPRLLALLPPRAARRSRTRRPAPRTACRSRRRSTPCSTSRSGWRRPRRGREPHPAGRGAARPGAHRRGDRRDRRGRPRRSTSSGFQPGVDDAIAQNATGEVTLTRPPSSASSPSTDAGEDHGDLDPHFWQDPLRLADLGDAVAAELAAPTPATRTAYERQRRRPALRPGVPRRGLRRRASRDCERTHRRRLPRRVRLPREVRSATMEPIAGLSPDAEPTPADLARLQDLIRARGHHHRVLRAAGQLHGSADTLADDLGITTAVLDPIEGLSDETAGEDYLSLMRAEPRPRSSGRTDADERRRPSLSRRGRSPSAAGPSCAASTSTVGTGEFVALMGANGSGKSTLVRALTGLRPLTSGSLHPVRHPVRGRSTTGTGSASCRSAPAPTSGVPASVWEVVASGRLTRRRLLRPLSRADRAAIDDAIAVVGLTEQGPRRRLPALGRPAAARADRPGAGRRARAVLPRRADRRASTCPTSTRSPTPCVAQGPRRDDRAGRPRARPAVGPRRPGRRDARRPDRLRRRRRSPTTRCTTPTSARSHTHHHADPAPARHDHAPHVASPLEPR